MRLINTLFLIAVMLSIGLYPCLKPALAIANGDERTYYTTAIETIIVNCEIGDQSEKE